MGPTVLSKLNLGQSPRRSPRVHEAELEAMEVMLS